MKKIILTGAALLALSTGAAVAADMPLKAPIMKAPPVVVSPWAGWYIGVNGGYAFDGRDPVGVAETLNGTPFVAGTWPGSGNFGNLKMKGAFGGAQAGYNWVSGSFLYGLESDFQFSDISARSAVTLPYIVGANTISVAASDRTDGFGTFRGRIGWLWNSALLYATGGLAYGNVHYRLAMVDTLNFQAIRAVDQTRAGFAAGAGIEFALAPRWTVKLEYQYIDLGSFNVGANEAGPGNGFAIVTKATPNFQTFRVGLNWHGDPLAIVARY
jgi:outer membrane immunogenic protein